MRAFVRLSLCLIVLAASNASHAVLSIEITKGLGTGLPIAIVPFFGENEKVFGQVISTIIRDDLARSGRFNSLPKKDFVSSPRNVDDIIYKDWRLLKAEALVLGSVQAQPDGRVHVEMHLHDVFKQQRLEKVSFDVEKSRLRAVGHKLSDMIYEKLTGERGVFSTRIAYISREGNPRKPTFKLYVSDADGYNPRAIVVSQEPLISLAWSPDGTRIAYVSFEEGRSMVFVQNVVDGKRNKIAQTKGINSAPAWSPDGTRMALVLSHEGSPDVYIYGMADGSLTRLTRNSSIDTEPAWSPDGREIVFTSDRAGRPQIYRTPATHERAERVTFEGEHNLRASYSPDGKSLTYVTRIEGAGGNREYHIAIHNMQDGSVQVLTDTPLDESPTFAPNGRMILYATRLQGRGLLATVSADGQVQQRLRSSEGDIREPAWSPN